MRKKSSKRATTKKRSAAAKAITEAPVQISTSLLPRLPPVGTELTKRDRQGSERAQCRIVEGGIEYGGRLYKSLSAAAMAAARDIGLTSPTMNGFAFWGLSKQRRPPKDQIEALERAWERYRERADKTIKMVSGGERAVLGESLRQHLGTLTALVDGSEE